MPLNDQVPDTTTVESSRLREILSDPNLRFPQYPKLANDLVVYDMPDGLGIQIRGVVEPIIIRGKQASQAIAHILSTSAESMSLPQILKAAPSRLNEVTILRTLLILHARGVIVDAIATKDDIPLPQSRSTNETKSARFWSRYLGISGSCASVASVDKSIAAYSLILLANGIFGAFFLETLIRAGFRNIIVANFKRCDFLHTAYSELSPFLHRTLYLELNSASELQNCASSLGQPDLFVTALRTTSDDDFQEINRLCLTHRWACLRGLETPERFEIGPFVKPFDSACLTCMNLRRRGVIEYPFEEKLFQDNFDKQSNKLISERGLDGETMASTLVPVGILVLECIRLATTISLPTLLNSTISIRSLDGEIIKNRILRVPHCPDCQTQRS
jgi:hypothetical protein